MDVTVDHTLNVRQAHDLGEQVARLLRQDVQYLTSALVLTDPTTAAAHQRAYLVATRYEPQRRFRPF